MPGKVLLKADVLPLALECSGLKPLLMDADASAVAL